MSRVVMSSSQSLGGRDVVALTQFSMEENIISPEELHYTLGKRLGSGTYAKVQAAWSPYERKMIAIKIIEKTGATREFLDKFLPREINALQQVRHTNILHVYRLVETPLQVYFMLEIAHNGDLLDYINTCRCLPEPQARFVMRGISAGIAHCHDKGIVHRDLKCENIMLTKDNIKIGDFGFARQVNETGSGVSTPCGSFSYAAPELFADDKSGRSTYNAKKADIWSMGCILYAMVCGRLPFGDDNQVAKNLRRPLEFTEALTEDCKNFIQFSMLNIDVDTRCSIDQLCVCRWMRGPVSTLTPYKHVIYTEENCLPRIILDPLSTEDVSYLSTHSQSSTRGRNVSSNSELRRALIGPTTLPESSTCDSNNISTTSSATQEVHRRKKTTVARLDQRLRVLKDPTHTAIMPRPTGIKAKISSAGKKVVQAFLHSSPSHGHTSYQSY